MRTRESEGKGEGGKMLDEAALPRASRESVIGAWRISNLFVAR